MYSIYIKNAIYIFIYIRLLYIRTDSFFFSKRHTENVETEMGCNVFTHSKTAATLSYHLNAQHQFRNKDKLGGRQSGIVYGRLKGLIRSDISSDDLPSKGASRFVGNI